MKANRTAEDLAYDQAVGARIRDYRKQLGMNQTALAKVAGVTFQQLQKYERGTNRIAASRLAAIAKGLGVEASALLDMSVESDALAPAERHIVDLFRQLSPEQQSLVRSMVRSMTKAAQ